MEPTASSSGPLSTELPLPVVDAKVTEQVKPDVAVVAPSPGNPKFVYLSLGAWSEFLDEHRTVYYVSDDDEKAQMQAVADEQQRRASDDGPGAGNNKRRSTRSSSSPPKKKAATTAPLNPGCGSRDSGTGNGKRRSSTNNSRSRSASGAGGACSVEPVSELPYDDELQTVVTTPRGVSENAVVGRHSNPVPSLWCTEPSNLSNLLNKEKQVRKMLSEIPSSIVQSSHLRYKDLSGFEINRRSNAPLDPKLRELCDKTRDVLNDPHVQVEGSNLIIDLTDGVTGTAFAVEGKTTFKRLLKMDEIAQLNTSRRRSLDPLWPLKSSNGQAQSLTPTTQSTSDSNAASPSQQVDGTSPTSAKSQKHHDTETVATALLQAHIAEKRQLQQQQQQRPVTARAGNSCELPPHAASPSQQVDGTSRPGTSPPVIDPPAPPRASGRQRTRFAVVQDDRADESSGSWYSGSGSSSNTGSSSSDEQDDRKETLPLQQPSKQKKSNGKL